MPSRPRTLRPLPLVLALLAASGAGSSAQTASQEMTDNGMSAPTSPSPTAESNVSLPPPTPPMAATRPHRFVEHGRERVDDYYWLRDDTRKDPGMLAYLGAENAYTQAVLAPTEPLQAKLYQELVSRLKQDDDTVPFHKDGFWYYRRFESGKEYDRLYRRKGSMSAPEELLLDLNELAAGHDYFQLGAWDVTPDGRRLAWTEDTVSRRQYTIHLLDLDDRRALPRDHRQLLERSGLGERQPDASSTSRKTR